MKLEVFSEILNDATARYNKIKKEDYLSDGLFPIIDQGQKFIGGYTNDKALVTDIEKEFIIFGDHTKALKFIKHYFFHFTLIKTNNLVICLLYQQ